MLCRGHAGEITRILIILAILQMSCPESYHPVYPEQIHLSFGESLQEMVVTWITFTDTTSSFVWYGKISEGLTLRSEGFSKKFVVGENARKVRFIHKVVLSDLTPLTFYVYRCGSWYGVSEAYTFKVSPAGMDWSPRLIIFGDMGAIGAAAFPYILREASDYHVDAIAHVGDIAYNMDSCDGETGDQFMRMIQPVASCVPYMTTVGNHEQSHNFSFYKNIFSMPGHSKGLFYSFDMGPAHFVAISTEVYYFSHYGVEPIINQYKWLLKDLKKASKPKTRISRPWIIVFGHRPLYCSSDDDEDCSLESSILRCCLINSCNYGLENLFHQFKVDLIFSGHMHYYERSWPIYNKQVFNGSCAEPYRNPGAAVHIITGAAGMKCGTESASFIRKDWFAHFSSEYSYTILTVHNKTHIYLEQISATRGASKVSFLRFLKVGDNEGPSSRLQKKQGFPEARPLKRRRLEHNYIRPGTPALSKAAMNQTKAMMKNLCKRSSGVTQDSLNELKAGVFPDDPKLKCYFHCCLGMMKTMKKDKITAAEATKQIEMLLPEEMREASLKQLNTCKDADAKGRNFGWWYKHSPELPTSLIVFSALYKALFQFSLDPRIGANACDKAFNFAKCCFEVDPNNMLIPI